MGHGAPTEGDMATKMRGCHLDREALIAVLSSRNIVTRYYGNLYLSRVIYIYGLYFHKLPYMDLRKLFPVLDCVKTKVVDISLKGPNLSWGILLTACFNSPYHDLYIMYIPLFMFYH